MTGDVQTRQGIRLPYPHPGQQKVRAEARRFNWLSAGRRWRKTTLAMSIAVEGAVEGETVVWGAPTFDQVRIGFEEAQYACASVANFNISRLTAQFPSGGRMIFRSLDNPHNVRGYTAHKVVIDEAAFVREEAWTEVLRPMLIDTGGDLWAIGTPNGMNWFWKEFQKAERDEKSCTWVIPTVGARVEGHKLVREPHPFENPDIAFSEIENLWYQMPERTFRQEILAQFIDFGGGVFRRVKEAIRGEPLQLPEKNHFYVGGVDIAATQDFTVVTIIDAIEKRVVYIDRFNRVDYNILEERLEEIARRFKLQVLVVESNSIGRPVIDHLLDRGLNVMPFYTSNSSKTQIIQNLQAAFEHDQLVLYDYPPLIEELLVFEGRELSNYWRWGAPPGFHDDCVMSLALAWNSLRYGPIEPVADFLFN